MGIESLHIILGKYKTLEAKFLCFSDALLNAVYRAYLSRQTYFSCHAHLWLYGRVHVAGEDGADDGKVYCRVVHFQSAGNIEKYIFLCQFEAYTFFQYGQQHIHAADVEPCGRALWVTIYGTADQCLRLDEERSDAFYRGGDGYAAHTFMVLAQQQFGWVAHLP